MNAGLSRLPRQSSSTIHCGSKSKKRRAYNPARFYFLADEQRERSKVHRVARKGVLLGAHALRPRRQLRPCRDRKDDEDDDCVRFHVVCQPSGSGTAYTRTAVSWNRADFSVSEKPCVRRLNEFHSVR